MLRFREDDTARITVRNRLRNETTSIHWHGILLPVEQEGAPEVTTPPIPPGGEHGEDPWDLMADGMLHSNLTMGRAMAVSACNNLSAMWEIGWEQVDGTECEIDLTFDRWFFPKHTAFAGSRLTNMHEAENRAVAGVWRRLPCLIGTTATIDSEGDFRFSVAKDFQITSRLNLAASVEYDTLAEWERMLGVEYVLARQRSLSVMHHSEFGFGGGVTLHF